MTLYAIGIMSYYVPDLTIIDFFGLTDATVARNPVTHLNHVRRIAHRPASTTRLPPAARRQLSSSAGSIQ